MVKIKQFSYGYQLNGVTKYSHGLTDIDTFTTGNFFKDEPNFLYIKNIFMKIQSIEIKEKDKNNNYIDDREENPSYQKYQVTNTKSGEKTYYWYNHTADWDSNYYIYYKYTNISNGTVINKTIDSTLENQIENTETEVKVTNGVYYSRNKNLVDNYNDWVIVNDSNNNPQRYRRKALDETLFSFVKPKYDFYFYFNGDTTRPLRAFFDGQDSFYFNIDQNNNQKVTLLQFDKDSLINNLSGQIIGTEEKSKGRLILTITYEIAD